MSLVDYQLGFGYGVGVDSLTGAIRGDAVICTPPVKVPGAEGQQWILRLDQIEASEDLYHALGLSAELNVSWGLFTGSGKFTFAENTRVSSYSLFLLVSMAVRNGFQQMREVQFTESAASLLQQGQLAVFRQRFGDTFVRGLLTGGEYYAVLEIKTRSSEEKQEMSAELAASYGEFVDAKGKFAEALSTKLQNKQVSIRAFANGGDEAVPQTLEEVIQKAVQFPATVAGKRSVPYVALLVDYQTLDIAGTPTWIDTLNAKETLMALASAQQFIRQKISDIDYILQNQGEFAGLNNSTLSQLNSTREQLRQQLMQTTRAASRCAHNVMDCEPATLEMPNLSFLEGFELPLHAGKRSVSEWTPGKEDRLIALRHKLAQMVQTLHTIDSTMERYQGMLRKNKQATLTRRDHRTKPPTFTTHKVSDLRRELSQRQEKLRQEQSAIIVEVAKLEEERASTMDAGKAGAAITRQPGLISHKALTLSTPVTHLVIENDNS